MSSYTEHSNQPELNNNPNIIRQWISEVIDFSSEYDHEHWGANRIIGMPIVYPRYGDIYGAWAQGNRDNNEYIEVKFEQVVYPLHLNIYETFHCGSVIKIKVKNMEDNQWIEVWENPSGPEDIRSSRIFSPVLSKVSFKTQEVRLEISCERRWCEIDAIEMIGKKHMVEKVDTETPLSLHLKNLLNSEEFCDVQFEIEGKLIKSHRNILAARSSFFKNILSENFKSYGILKPVHIDNISYETFKSLMFYLYTGTIEKNTTGEIVCELMRVSDWYYLDKLEDIGYIYLKDNICHDNVLSILVSATQNEPQLERVEKICLKYLSKNFNSILNNAEFKNLDKNIVVKIAQFYGQFFQKTN